MDQKMKYTCGSRGFTLIELLVVISIIGLLSSIVLASLNSAKVKADNAARTLEVGEYLKALNSYYAQNGAYPPGQSATRYCLADYPSQTCSYNGGTFDEYPNGDLFALLPSRPQLKPVFDATTGYKFDGPTYLYQKIENPPDPSVSDYLEWELEGSTESGVSCGYGAYQQDVSFNPTTNAVMCLLELK